MIIMKFGGTSVKNAAAIHKVIEIIKHNLHKKPIIVVSALAGITNLLEESVQIAVSQKSVLVGEVIRQVQERHLSVIQELFGQGESFHTLSIAVSLEIKKLQSLLTATETIRVESNDLNHAVLSIGEILSSRILSTALQKEGIDAVYVDAREIMITTNKNNQIIPVPEKIQEEATTRLQPLLDADKTIVSQGFIAATSDGIPTTLGRNGSDFSASLLGAALNADEIQIWTDVDGILTADPTIIPSAKLLDFMTFDEASELAYFGARVLYPAAIQPAVEKGIPVRVLNSNRPDSAGTLILKDSVSSKAKIVKSIAYKENITLVTLKSSQLLLSTKILGEFFQHLAEHNMRVYALSKSAIKLSLTLEHTIQLDHILERFNRSGQFKVERHKAIVSVVGEKMKRNPEITGQILAILRQADIPTDLISQFASQISFMFIISEKDIERTIKLLHMHYIEKEN
jgi:aspartate kinase